MNRLHALAAMTLLAALSAVSTPLRAADKPDLDYQRLSASLATLAQDPTLGRYALGEQARARAALQRLLGTSGKQRQHLLYLAEHRVAIAQTEAEVEDAQTKMAQLEREHDRILLEASRRDTETARKELERQRLQSMAANEEAQRLQAQGQAYAQQAQQSALEAAQATKLAAAQSQSATLAKKEAALAEAAVRAMRARLDTLTPTRGARGMQITLEDYAFAPGHAELRPEARGHLGKLVEFVQAHPGKPILIEGYTDSTGSAAGNLALSRQRAQAVADALTAAGVSAGRIRVAGRGEADPVASNATAAGRARNRRVVVILRDR